MTKLPPYDSVMTPYKSIEYPKKAKGISFFAFIFSIFIYISIFYIFNLSPSTVFNNTKFWFLISNTLIVIIAVDYGSFSSSKGKADVYDEYVRHSQARSTTSHASSPYPSSSFVSQHPEIVKKSNIIHKQEEEVEKQVIKALEKSDEKNPDNKLQIVTKNEPEKLNHDVDHEKPSEDIQEKRIIHVVDPGGGKACHEDGKKTESAKTYRRSKSEKAKRVVIDERKNIDLRRSETEKLKEVESDHVEENEFSSMSNEELNRRVEEFIQKFNRQIRLQAVARNFQQV